MTAEDRMERAWRMIFYALVIAVALVVFLTVRAFAQEHKHPPEHQALHDRFYQHWKMPDNRAVSCCHGEDCKPAEAFKRDGQWFARQEGDAGEFTPIPKEKVDLGLPDSPDNPDGRNHLCGRKGIGAPGFYVYCFQPAAGY